MRIHYELPVDAFIQFLLSCTLERKTGIVLFFSESADWGKIVINQGKLLSIRFKNLNGLNTLLLIQELKMVQYHFRVEESINITMVRDRDLNNELFFNFFGIKTLNSSKTATAQKNDKHAISHSVGNIVKTNIENSKILIADDSPTARKAISRVLLEAGYQVVEARNGFEALGQIENEHPNLLLLDLIMPGIDGYALIKTLSRTLGKARMPIVVLTSRDGLLDKLKSMTLSCDAYLTKPIDSKILLETTSKLLTDLTMVG